eukprot:g2956.t1
MYDGYQNPSTSLEVTDETYEFPYVLACFFPGSGCGWADESTDQCVWGALEYSTVLDHNYEERGGIVVESMWSNCVGFNLPALGMVENEVPPDEASAQIDMEWVTTDIASEELDYYDRIYIFLSDSEPTQNNLSFMAVPYTRTVPDETATVIQLTLAELTLTEPDGDYAYGQMNIHFSQGSFSRTRVKELNPIDLGDFFGNIGGFWELLIVLWGLFFIASRADDAPKLKAREFIQPVKSIIRRRSLSVDSGTSGSVTEERPHWEAAYRGSNPTSNAVPPLPPRGGATMAGGTAAAVGFPIIAPMNGGSVDDHQRRQSNDETYEFPYVLACFFPGNGCGWADESTDQCVWGALEGSTVLDHNYEERDDIVVQSMWSNCVGFNLPALGMVEDEVPPEKATCLIDMEWTTTDIASEELNYYDRIYIFLSDSEPTQTNLSFMAVPYSRIVPDETATVIPLTLAELTIGKTTKENLDGDVTTTYPPLIMSSHVYTSENTLTEPDGDYAYGQMNIHFSQGSFSRTRVKELKQPSRDFKWELLRPSPMWKPKEVVPEHRWRARIVWTSLLMAIAAYTIWQACDIHMGYKNPSTSLEVTNETYEFPYMLVCFSPANGCGWEDESTDACVWSALEYSTVFDHNSEEREDIVVESMWSNCVGFDLPKLNILADGVARGEATYGVWIVTDIASEEEFYINSVPVSFSESEPEEDDSPEFVSVPYSRVVPEDDVAVLPLTLIDVAIGKTTRQALDGRIAATYPALTVTPLMYSTPNTLSEDTETDYAYGQMNLLLTQGPYSRVSVKELSPLDLGTFFGNVGGFWELLVVLWGLFFIASRADDAPKLKAREFIEPVKSIIRRRSLSVDSGTSGSVTEERPHWEAAYRGSNPTSNAPPPLPPRGGATMAGGTAAAVGFPIIAPMNGGSVDDHQRRQSNAHSARIPSREPGVERTLPPRGGRPGVGT